MVLSALLSSTLGVSVMPFFSWDPVLLLGVLVYLVLVSRSLPFEDREERYHWKCLLSWLRVFKTVPAMQVFYTQYFYA